jgi:uncharacterized protein
VALIEETRAGPVIRVRAKPNASHDVVLGITGERLIVAVRANPEKGKANAAVLTTIAKWLGVSKSSLELLSGAGARDKRIAVTGLTAAELRARVRELTSI